MGSVSFRIYACTTGVAAIAAAAGGHAAVGMLASLGLFSGSYGGYRHDGFIFAVAAVAAIAAGFAALAAITAMIEALKPRSHGDRLALLRSMHQPGSKTVAFVFCVQMPVLACIEALEQIQHFGHPISVIASLGGPPLISLAIHGVLAVAFTVLAFRAVRVIADASLKLANIIVPLVRRTIIAANASGAADLRLAIAKQRIARAAPLALRISNRPPPLVTLS